MYSDFFCITPISLQECYIIIKIRKLSNISPASRNTDSVDKTIIFFVCSLFLFVYCCSLCCCNLPTCTWLSLYLTGIWFNRFIANMTILTLRMPQATTKVNKNAWFVSYVTFKPPQYLLL